MMHQIFSTTWKELKILFKDIGGLVSLFLMPMMFIIVMSIALQGMFSIAESDTRPIQLPVVNLDQGDLAADVIAQLDAITGIQIETAWDGEMLTRERAEALVVDGQRAVVVIFPGNFTQQIEARAGDADVTASIELVTDPAVSTQFIAPIQGMVFGAAERVAETTVAQAHIASHLEDAWTQIPEGMRPERDPISITLHGTSVVQLSQVTPPVMNVESMPDSYQQNVPGYTIFGVFFIVGTMASSILEEKREGTFRRLLVAPLPRPALLAGKILPYYIVNLIQITIMFGVAHLLFGMAFGDLAALIGVSLALAAAATGLGVLVATFGKTGTQIDGLASLLTLTMSAIGGCMVPSFIMPQFLQTLSRLTPHGWAMQGFQDVLVRGYGLTGVVPEIGALFGFGALFFLIGVWRFRFE